jgi:hypothetical protein
MGCGKPPGANSPHHWLTAKAGTPDSAIVGISGRNGERLADDTASERSRPAFVCGNTSSMGIISIWIWSPINAATAGVPPLNGTCTVWILATRLNISIANWISPPTPAEP